MNYIELILEGYTNWITKEHLPDYFIRKFKEAERDYFFTASEFFDGCLNAIALIDTECSSRYLDRLREIMQMLRGAEKGTMALRVGNIDLIPEDGQVYETERQVTITYCKHELTHLKKEQFPVNLWHLTNSRFNGNIYSSEIEYIKEAILKAQAEIIQPEQNTPTPTPKNQPKQQAPIIKPVFKPEAIQTILDILKDFFSPEHQTQLKLILETGDNSSEKLLFLDKGNRLTDTFKKLIEFDFITGCQKQNLQEWIIENFTFLKHGKASTYKLETVEKSISRNDNPCKSPIIEIKNGQICKAEQPRQKKYTNY